MKRFGFDPVCLLLWVWLFLFCGVAVASSYIAAIFLHELGHYFVAKFLGYKLNKFSLTAYGVSLSYFDQNLDYKDETKIALAGPLMNLISAFLIVGLWWLLPVSYFFTFNFVQISVALALINLLPCYPMDGGRIFCGFANFFVNEKIAKKITIFLNFLFGLIFFVLFIAFCFINFNPSYLLFSIFLILGLFDLKFVSKYEKINIFNKKIKNFAKPIIICVDESVTLKELIKKISTSKTIIFAVCLENGKIINISEKMLIKLSLNYKIDTKLEKILKKY